MCGRDIMGVGVRVCECGFAGVGVDMQVWVYGIDRCRYVDCRVSFP